MLSFSLLLSGCIVGPQNDSFDPVSARIFPDQGENRLMLRTTTREITGGPVTRLHTLRLTEFEKDTLFEGRTARIVGRTEWEFWSDTVVEHHARSLIVQHGDSVVEYVFRKSSSTFASDLFKSSADTSVFSDRLLQLVSPLSAGQFWTIRDDGNAWGRCDWKKSIVGRNLWSSRETGIPAGCS